MTTRPRHPPWSRTLSALAAILLLLTTPTPLRAGDRTPQPEPVRIVVTIPPLLWPVRELLGAGPGGSAGGSAADTAPGAAGGNGSGGAPPSDARDPSPPIEARLTLILRPGLSEHGFELTPSQMEDVKRADIIVMAGHGLEPRIAALAAQPRAGPQPPRSVVSFEGLIEALHASGDHSACDHDHDHDHDLDHAPQAAAEHAPDPHMWLDPVLMKGLVSRVELALAAALEHREPDPSRRAAAITALNARAHRARAVCDQIHREHADALAPLKGRAIVTHHNAWAYLCARYHLTVAAVIRPIDTVEPTPGDVMLAVKAIRQHDARAVFVEPQFPGGVAQRIANTARVRLETLDPLGDGDWPATMRSNLAALLRGLADPVPAAAPPSPPTREPR